MGDFIAIGIVVLILGIAIVKIYRDKKNNVCGCGKSCGGCPGSCEQKEE